MEMIFQQKLLEKAYCFVKMTGPASSDFWKDEDDYENQIFSILIHFFQNKRKNLKSNFVLDVVLILEFKGL